MEKLQEEKKKQHEHVEKVMARLKQVLYCYEVNAVELLGYATVGNCESQEIQKQ
jgi:hypothetical protein